MVVVAVVALAHIQAGQVLERIFGIGGIDGGIDLAARDAFDGGGDLGGQRADTLAGDGDGTKVLVGAPGGQGRRAGQGSQQRGSKRGKAVQHGRSFV